MCACWLVRGGNGGELGYSFECACERRRGWTVGGDVFEGSMSEECWKEKEKRVKRLEKKNQGLRSKNKHHVRHA